MKQRFLVLGAVGAGKSTFINLLVNHTKDMTSIIPQGPAQVSDRLTVTTSSNTLYCTHHFSIVDTVGVEDLVESDVDLLLHTSQFTKIFYILRYRHLTSAERSFLNKFLSTPQPTWTIIFNGGPRDMNLERIQHANSDLVLLLKNAGSVLFGTLESSDAPEDDSTLCKRRKNLIEEIYAEIDVEPPKIASPVLHNRLLLSDSGVECGICEV